MVVPDIFFSDVSLTWRPIYGVLDEGRADQLAESIRDRESRIEVRVDYHQGYFWIEVRKAP